MGMVYAWQGPCTTYVQGLIVCEGDVRLPVSGVIVYSLGLQCVGIALAVHGGSALESVRIVSGRGSFSKVCLQFRVFCECVHSVGMAFADH